ncbi:MAG TPA: chromate efflux transporter [Steroidobacteraceae bacterium]
MRNAAEVGAAFLKLGLSSFGGPIAHLGYFRREFVERRRWIDDQRFGQLLALCQFLPGPASSQLGFSLGLLRAGWAGAIAAFIGFTLPSALLMFALAESGRYLTGPWGQSAVHGLKLVAVAVVAQGVLGMARTLTPDAPRALMAAGAAGMVLVSGSAWMQLLVIAGGAALGPWLCRQTKALQSEGFDLPYGRRVGIALLAAFGALLIAALWIAPATSPLGQAAGAFYRAGALVFGGGHVVLPLLKQAVVDPGWIDNDTFLAGYGAAQAVPGPLFSVAVFLGARLFGGQAGALGAIVSLMAIFLPGFLILAATLPFWRTLSARDGTARMLAGVNAVVVGLLAAALYNPVWISAVQDPKDFAVALIGFVFLVAARWPSWAAVLWCVLASMIRLL